MAGLIVLAACSREPPPSEPKAPGRAQLAAAAVAPAPAPKPAVAKTGAAADDFTISALLEPDRPVEAGDYVWSAEGAPAGAPLRIVVDIEWRRVYVYRGGVEIGRSSIIYGADDKPTPLGTFPILEKDKDHVSNLYDAAMPYMLRLTWDGVALHSSEMVDDYTATNGCVGLPHDFAALLFAEAKLGDKVLVTKNWLNETYNAEA